jgi:hypothetical protein
MAKLKSSFTTSGSKKLPAISTASPPSTGAGKVGLPRDLSARTSSSSSAGSISQALKFGTPHTKTSSVVGQSESQWMSILNSASGGGSGLLGGGLLSAGGFGFVSKLLNLFGGGKSSPAAPVQFQAPASQQQTLNITTPGSASSVSLGVHPVSLRNQGAGTYLQAGSTVPNHLQSLHVVQIVKQALLTSSSLNDVISEI